MKYELVLQWPASSIEDYDSMIELEELIIRHLTDEEGEVDGHDAGSGQMNIFIRTDFPERVFGKLRNVLSAHDFLGDARAAFHETGRDEYEILWPKSMKKFSIV